MTHSHVIGETMVAFGRDRLLIVVSHAVKNKQQILCTILPRESRKSQISKHRISSIKSIVEWEGRDTVLSISKAASRADVLSAQVDEPRGRKQRLKTCDFQ